jgi:hypothetical protein
MSPAHFRKHSKGENHMFRSRCALPFVVLLLVCQADLLLSLISVASFGQHPSSQVFDPFPGEMIRTEIDPLGLSPEASRPLLRFWERAR